MSFDKSKQLLDDLFTAFSYNIITDNDELIQDLSLKDYLVCYLSNERSEFWRGQIDCRLREQTKNIMNNYVDDINEQFDPDYGVFWYRRILKIDTFSQTNLFGILHALLTILYTKCSSCIDEIFNSFEVMFDIGEHFKEKLLTIVENSSTNQIQLGFTKGNFTYLTQKARITEIKKTKLINKLKKNIIPLYIIITDPNFISKSKDAIMKLKIDPNTLSNDLNLIINSRKFTVKSYNNNMIEINNKVIKVVISNYHSTIEDQILLLIHLVMVDFIYNDRTLIVNQDMNDTWQIYSPVRGMMSSVNSIKEFEIFTRLEIQDVLLSMSFYKNMISFNYENFIKSFNRTRIYRNKEIKDIMHSNRTPKWMLKISKSLDSAFCKKPLSDIFYYLNGFLNYVIKKFQIKKYDIIYRQGPNYQLFIDMRTNDKNLCKKIISISKIKIDGNELKIYTLDDSLDIVYIMGTIIRIEYSETLFNHEMSHQNNWNSNQIRFVLKLLTILMGIFLHQWKYKINTHRLIKAQMIFYEIIFFYKLQNPVFFDDSNINILTDTVISIRNWIVVSYNNMINFDSASITSPFTFNMLNDIHFLPIRKDIIKAFSGEISISKSEKEISEKLTYRMSVNPTFRLNSVPSNLDIIQTSQGLNKIIKYVSFFIVVNMFQPTISFRDSNIVGEDSNMYVLSSPLNLDFFSASLIQIE